MHIAVFKFLKIKKKLKIILNRALTIYQWLIINDLFALNMFIAELKGIFERYAKTSSEGLSYVIGVLW